LIVVRAHPLFISRVAAIQSQRFQSTSIEETHFVRRLLGGHFLKELFRHSHASQVSLDPFRQRRVFLFDPIARLREYFPALDGELSSARQQVPTLPRWVTSSRLRRIVEVLLMAGMS
jgi:hypothetical protein